MKKVIRLIICSLILTGGQSLSFPLQAAANGLTLAVDCGSYLGNSMQLSQASANGELGRWLSDLDKDVCRNSAGTVIFSTETTLTVQDICSVVNADPGEAVKAVRGMQVDEDFCQSFEY